MAKKLSTVELEHYKMQLASVIETQKATTAFEHAALKPAYYLNGGAVAVYAAYVGQLEPMPADPSTPIAVWAFGLLAAFFASYFGHESQLSFYKAANQNARAVKMQHTDNSDDAETCRILGTKFNKKGKQYRGQLRLWLLLSIAAFMAGVFNVVGSMSS